MDQPQLIVVGAFVLVQLLLLGLVIDGAIIAVLAFARWAQGE